MVLLEKMELPLGFLVNVPSLLPVAWGPEQEHCLYHRGLLGHPSRLQMIGPLGHGRDFCHSPPAVGPSQGSGTLRNPSSW